MLCHPEKLRQRDRYCGCFFLEASFINLPRLESRQHSQSVADEDGKRETGGHQGGGKEGEAKSPLSAEVLLCRVSHIFPLLAVARVVRLVARFGARGGALLPRVAALMVGTRRPGLVERTRGTENKFKNSVRTMSRLAVASSDLRFILHTWWMGYSGIKK